MVHRFLGRASVNVRPSAGMRALVVALMLLDGAACSGGKDAGSTALRPQDSTTTAPPAAPVPGDTVPPNVPSNLRISATSATTLSFAWSASTDNIAVAGYKVLRNGLEVRRTLAATVTDSGLAAGTTYVYRVAAYDAAGNTSAPSPSFIATTTNGKTFTMQRRLGAEVAGWHWGYAGGPWRPDVDDDLIQSAKDAGITVFHLMLPVFERPLGTFLESEFVKLDYFLAVAATKGMYVMPSFINIYGNAAMQSDDPYYNPTGLEGLVFDGPLKTAFRRRIATLVNRTNTVNGRKYREDPTILAWIIGDEPISASFNYPVRAPNLTVQQFREWLEETAAYVNTLDSTHPVSIYIHPAQSSLTDGDWLESLAAPSAAFEYAEDADMRILNYFPGYVAGPYPLRLLALGRPLAVMLSFTSGTWPSSICRDYALQAQLIERAVPAYLDAGASLVLVQNWESDLFPSLSSMPFCNVLTDASAPMMSALRKVSALMRR